MRRHWLVLGTLAAAPWFALGGCASGTSEEAPDGSGASGSGGSNNCVEEICNGSDDDCDGEVDEGCDCTQGETQSCYSGPDGTINVGACVGGEQTCTAGQWGACEGEVVPVDELCNGEDDDCDDETDEGFGEVTCGLGVCQVTVDECVDGVPQACEPGEPAPVETCEGTDDDCDGQVDEGCHCTGTETQPCYPATPDTIGVGPCVQGEQTCADGEFGECMGAVTPVGEACDGVDNNCNGVVDDGGNACGGVCALANIPGMPCDGADTDLCTEGVWTCDGLNQVYCSDDTGNNVEVCDAVDDDCDGNPNEGPCSLPNATSSCFGGGCQIDSCNNGYNHCDANVANGCELQHSGYSNSAPGENLGSHDADAASGFGCPGQGCIGPFVTRNGTRGRYFTIQANEASSCCAYVSLKFELIVPAGIDYDLFITGNGCFADPAFSATGNGNKTITVWCNDDCGGGDNGFNANVEVRYVSGQSCTPWTLNVYRRQC